MDFKEYVGGELVDLKRGLMRYLDGLTSQEILWRPAYGCNSIALIMYHMSRFEDSFCQVKIQGKRENWYTEKWYKKLDLPENDSPDLYTVEQVNSFTVPDVKEIIEYFDAVRTSSIDCLNSLSAEEIDRKVPEGPGEVPVGKVFSFIVGHMAQHMGAITYLRGLQRGMKIAHV
jgi:uncharacterized damage-inducible protein DinB